MDEIVFIDTEIDAKTKRILNIGGINDLGERFHAGSASDFIRFVSENHFT